LKYTKLFSLTLVVALFATTVLRAEVSVAEFEAMKKEMHDMRTQMSGMKGADAPLESVVDKAAAAAAPAPNNVTTGTGNLTMGGLVQVWYTVPRNDKKGPFNNATLAGTTGTNAFDSAQAYDKNTFSVHTVELYFDMAVTKEISAFVYINPAAEIGSNTRPVMRHTLASVSPEFATAVAGGFGGFQTGSIGAQQAGAGGVPNLLQDALVNFHPDAFKFCGGSVDFTVGQMLNTFNEENFAANNSLDFVDRSYIGNQVSRDTGAVIHGSFWGAGGGGSYVGAGDTGRVQFWAGVWDGAGSLYGGAINRQDDNNDKDFVGTLLLRPLWSECWGNMEWGYSFRAGKHGQHGTDAISDAAAVNPSGSTLSRAGSDSIGHDGWFKYFAPGCLKGLWLKSEVEWLRDRTLPNSVIDMVTPGYQDTLNTIQTQPVSSFGYWGAIGYKLSDSPLFCPSCHNWYKNFEFDGRYEKAPNIMYGNEAKTYRVNIGYTDVYTAGINYYIAGQNAKLQLNYNILNQQTTGGQGATHLHNPKDSSLVMNFQVSW